MLLEHGAVSDFSHNAFVPSVVNTLEAAGFNVRLFNPVASGRIGDVLFVATKQPFRINDRMIGNDVFLKAAPLASFQLQKTDFNTEQAVVFTDDRCEADILLREHYFRVRKSIRNELARLERQPRR